MPAPLPGVDRADRSADLDLRILPDRVIAVSVEVEGLRRGARRGDDELLRGLQGGVVGDVRLHRSEGEVARLPRGGGELEPAEAPVRPGKVLRPDEIVREERLPLDLGKLE